MNYEEFKEELKNKFKDYLSDPYKEMEVSIQPLNKTNRISDGLCLVGSDNAVPVMHIDKIYEVYKKLGFDETLKMTATVYEKALNNAPEVNLDSKKIKQNVVFQLINTEQNRELLNNLPHREYLDLSIVYRWVICIDKEEGMHSSFITNTLAEHLGVDEEQLFMLAASNTKRIFPPIVKPISDVIKEMFPDLDILDEIFELERPHKQMYVISNEYKMLGAVAILYDDILHNLAEQLGSDLYILPSSIDEVIAISTNLDNPDALAQMVTEINIQQVKLADRLSNQVYHYDRESGKLTLATDTPNKSLYGVVE